MNSAHFIDSYYHLVSFVLTLCLSKLEKLLVRLLCGPTSLLASRDKKNLSIQPMPNLHSLSNLTSIIDAFEGFHPIDEQTPLLVGMKSTCKIKGDSSKCQLCRKQSKRSCPPHTRTRLIPGGLR